MLTGNLVDTAAQLAILGHPRHCLDIPPATPRLVALHKTQKHTPMVAWCQHKPGHPRRVGAGRAVGRVQAARWQRGCRGVACGQVRQAGADAEAAVARVAPIQGGGS